MCVRLVGLLCFLGLVAGCRVPTVPAVTTLRLYDTFSVGGTVSVQVYECWDSTVFAHPRYVPFFLFRPADRRLPLYVAAWQEYLGRFAGPLRPAQKELLRSVLQRERVSDSLCWWRIPTYEGEVSDLQHITPVRNLYWSVERYAEDVTEVAVVWLRSYPQTEPWQWRPRPAGFWQRLRQEALALYPELKRHVQRDLEHYVTHTPVAP